MKARGRTIIIFSYIFVLTLLMKDNDMSTGLIINYITIRRLTSNLGICMLGFMNVCAKCPVFNLSRSGVITARVAGGGGGFIPSPQCS